jgi:hypothetical protein
MTAFRARCIADRPLAPGERVRSAPDVNDPSRICFAEINSLGIPEGFTATLERCRNCGDLVGFVQEKTGCCFACELKAGRVKRSSRRYRGGRRKGDIGSRTPSNASNREICNRIKAANKLRKEAPQIFAHPSLEQVLPSGERKNRGNSKERRHA